MEQASLDKRTKAAVRTGVTVAALFGMGMTALVVINYREYGLVLFILIPMTVGALAPIVAGFIAPLNTKTSVRAGMLSVGLVGIGLILTAIEGLACLIMAAPIAGVIAYLGSTVGDYIQRSYRRRKSPLHVVVVFLFLLPPSLLTVERRIEPSRETHPITTTIEINAPVEVVWENVVSFPQLSPPTEFLFKAGIAYPIRARIEGKGIGAIRYCDFSTGSFVEPITVWEENKRLAFSVKEQPIPMKEFSPYGDIDPAHLHGYFVSTKGEFRLIDLGNGRTRLEGTTWYYQRLRPGFYWNLWADKIIHAIHGRVLRHIKQEAERRSHTPIEKR